MTAKSIPGMSVEVHENTSEFFDMNYLNSVFFEGEGFSQFGMFALDDVGLY